MSKVWLITGSSRGLGRHVVRAALERGDRVLGTARRPEALAGLVAQYGDRLRTIAHDVAVPAQATAAVQAALDSFGRLDVVVNNAGYADLASVEDMSEKAFRDQIEAVFFGTVYTTKAALPVLREQASGHIINITSVGSRMATPGLSAYQSAKWATAGFSAVLAAEVAPLGIKVTSLEPGGMATDWAGSSMTVPEISEPYQTDRRRRRRDARLLLAPTRRPRQGSPGHPPGRRHGRATRTPAARQRGVRLRNRRRPRTARLRRAVARTEPLHRPRRRHCRRTRPPRDPRHSRGLTLRPKTARVPVRPLWSAGSNRADRAAVDRDHRAGDVGSGRGQQKRCRPRELFGLSVPSERD